MLINHPGNLVERRGGTVNSNGQIDIPIARNGSGNYIVCITSESSGQGVFVSRGMVNGMINNNVVGRYDFGQPGSCGR